MSEQIIVVDEGSAQGIGAWYNEKTKKIEFHLEPSMIGREVDTNPIGDPLDNSYMVGEDEYCVSPSLTNPVTTKRETYQTSVENRVLVHEVLRKAGFGGKDIKIMSTLPITQYYYGDSSQRNNDLITLKKRNLMGEIKNINDVPLAHITEAFVAPESIPGFFDHAINEKGEWVFTLQPGEVAMVVDIGGTTTDMCIIAGAGSPQRKFSAPWGVFDIAAALATEMIAAGVAKRLPRGHLDAVLRSGKYRGVDCREMIKKASQKVMKDILGQMQSFENDSKALEKIIFVGGGAAIIGKELAERYENPENSVIPENPDLAVARGLVKMQLAQRLAKEAKVKAETAEA